MRSVRAILLLVTLLVSAGLACESGDEPVARSTAESEPAPATAQPPAESATPKEPTPPIEEKPPPTEKPILENTVQPGPSTTPMTLVRVVPASINVRSGPGTNQEVITMLAGGDIVPLVGRNEDGSWYQIQLDDGTIGWVGSTVTEITTGSGDAATPEVVAQATEDEGQPETAVPTLDSTATPAPALFVEVFNVSEYPSDGDLWLYREVRNPGSRPAKDVELTATLYDDGGAVTAVKSSYADMPLSFSLWFTGVLYPGEVAPFKILIEEPGNWVSWRITATYAEAQLSDYEEHYRDLRILNDQGRPISDLLYNYRVTGEIENIGQIETGQVRITTTLYDSEGRVVGSDEFGMSELDPLMPGRITPFEVELYTRGPVASYVLLIRSVRND